MPQSGLHREPEAMPRPGVRPAARRELVAIAIMLGGLGIVIASAASLLLA